MPRYVMCIGNLARDSILSMMYQKHFCGFVVPLPWMLSTGFSPAALLITASSVTLNLATDPNNIVASNTIARQLILLLVVVCIF
jgi:hypothetical protein